MVEYVYRFKCGNQAVFFNNNKKHHSVLGPGQSIEFPALRYRIKKMIIRSLNLTYRQWVCKLNSH